MTETADYQPGPEIRAALDAAATSGLILSWRQVPGRGPVVIAGDMAEWELHSAREAGLFCGALSGAACAIADGKADLGAALAGKEAGDGQHPQDDQ